MHISLSRVFTLIALLVGVLGPLLLTGQGVIGGGVDVFNPVVTTALEETLEGRIFRLKEELRQAEEALLALSGETAERAAENQSSELAIAAGALVIVAGQDGSGGSGFIAELRDRMFFVTNIHVLAAARGSSFKTVNGQEVILPDVVFLSRQRDLAIVPITWSGDFLQISPSLSYDQVTIGDAVTVMGNSDGAGVATRLQGDVDGIGPMEIEISAKFVPGNSGSPIMHDELGTVIGVVSHMRDLSTKDKWTEDSELADIRRFGFRLDGEIDWQRVSLAALFDQGETYERFEDRTTVLARSIYMLKHERTILTAYSSHQSLGYLFDPFEGGFSWKRGTSSSNNIIKLERFMNGLHNELITDRQKTRDALTVDFLRKRFNTMDDMRDYFEGQLKNVSF